MPKSYCGIRKKSQRSINSHHFIKKDKYPLIRAGKAICAINIGAGLNKLRKRVLLIDLDPRHNFLTYSLWAYLLTSLIIQFMGF